MADRSVYLDNQDEQISGQKRLEMTGRGVASVAATVGATALFILGKRKVNLSRAISAEIRDIRGAAAGLDRYLVTKYMSSKSAGRIASLKSWVNNVSESLVAPIPTGMEQYSIAISKLRSRGVALSEQLPHDVMQSIRGWSAFDTYTRGPIAAIAPRSPLIAPGMRTTSGFTGGISAAGHLVRLNSKGRVASIISGVSTGIGGTSGARTELLRAFPPQKFNTLEAFTRGALTPLKRDVILEHRRIFLENYLQSAGYGATISHAPKATRKDIVDKLISEVDRYSQTTAGNTPGGLDLLRANRDKIKASYRSAIDTIVGQEVKKPYAKAAFKLYNIQEKAGIGEQFARYESGDFQKQWRSLRESLGMNLIDPTSGRPYPVRGRRYLQEGKSVTGEWEQGVTGRFFVYPRSGSVKRAALDFIEGTVFKQLENVSGMGLSTAPNRFTNMVSHLVGAQEGSYGEYAIRRYVGGFGRLAVLGAGSYATFRLLNYFARQATGGWGVTDVAGKMYTSSREFQQKTIDQLGIVNIAKKIERAFPGTIKSPAMTIARATAPLWMTHLGRKIGGKQGAMAGLALGIATALITWGDITQSPEELHRIYTGEQDIPVRKGRYWMFGKTPFGGGKISYWRPHWYPLLRSKYKYQGQLWGSETEELAQGTFMSPILAPLLQQRLWDPYYWEKKHYKDRPYPLTGELFEPTMPFAWLGNMTVGNLIKPQRQMHQQYGGVPQGEPGVNSGAFPGAGSALGMDSYSPSPFLPRTSPDSVGWRAGEAAYTLAEQMGMRGFLVNTMFEDLTGRPDFLPAGPVVQSARRATGYERSYWDLNIGDPANVTEFGRRMLPHRRRGIEEYNPIPNEMPDWVPGEDYFINFRQGDPYTKVEMGEARLPGPGYESLHHLHSGIPHIYDAVDRFLVLSDIAPYSKEYTQYKILAQSMTRKDPYWSEIFKKHVEQKEKLREEYEFLDLKPPPEVTGLLRPISSIYRHVVAGITGAGSVLEPVLSAGMMAQSGQSPLFSMALSPVSKFFPYKTARQAYRDYRLQGSEFTDWGNPYRDFIAPYFNKIADLGARVVGKSYVPGSEKERREYEEYFDKLEYVKNKRLENMALSQGNSRLASQLSARAAKTMTGADPFAAERRLMGALPKRERAFFSAFSNATGAQRGEILSMVSPQMGNIYESQWALRDGRGRVASNPDYENANAAVDYFKTRNFPGNTWSGWNPDVSMDDVQLKVVRNEGMNIHNFDLWESQERALARRPYVHPIDNIHGAPGDVEGLKRSLLSQLQNDGYSNSRIYASRTPASTNSTNIRIKVKKRSDSNSIEHTRAMLNV